MKQLFKPTIFIGALLILFCLMQTSCVKKKDFPIVPEIEFLQYIAYGRDSADCIISFKDGDGDIGYESLDSLTPKDISMKYLVKDKVTGVFMITDDVQTPLDFNDSTYFKFPVNAKLTPSGQNKALEGEIKVKLRSSPIYNPPPPTTVKFEITLSDRAGNISNTVTTNEIVIP